MSKVTPLGGTVFVKPDPRKLKTEAGLVLPAEELNIEKIMEGSGIVVAVSESKKDKLGLLPDDRPKPGDRVLFRIFMKDAKEYEINGKKCAMINLRDIIAIIDTDDVVGIDNYTVKGE